MEVIPKASIILYDFELTATGHNKKATIEHLQKLYTTYWYTCVYSSFKSYVKNPCEQFGRLLLKFKKSNNNAELLSPVGRKRIVNQCLAHVHLVYVHDISCIYLMVGTKCKLKLLY